MSAIVPTTQAEIMERVIASGDLSKLTPGERVSYYMAVCQSLGLNPLVKPFDYITLNGRLTLYATKVATDQLRKDHEVSIRIVSRERMESVYIVAAQATDKTGRVDESTGVVNVANLQGDALANALMKAETKAKRRVTLSIVGLGWLDETEIETIRDARPVAVDVNTGEIVDSPQVQTVTTPAGNGKTDAGSEPMSEVQRKALHAVGSDFYGAAWNDKRPELVKAVTEGRSTSSSDLTNDEAAKLISGLRKRINARNAEAAKTVPVEQESMLQDAAAANEHSTWGAQAL